MQYGLTDEEIQKLKSVFASYPSIEKVLLYGSRAKGTFKAGSDVDITLVGTNLDEQILRNIILAIDNLLLIYNFDISLFASLTNTDLLEHIERVGKAIYEKQ